ncbi:BadF/BadG/BcrA/BcrD ATPase family protein [Paludicola sp. MB14-C6]|uniref:N-acetylglucosamine kinase n=1 Tax=Paludihabitans sp. MB14-C6 TaxID=3070656 RepID=UPI0027DBABF1|nr:BadF/BadG/BcrA/BcrD ATPase family protein [Paludicola sp. MB14-C6]WMJ24388.1 BadF/BadG/BcrA/BcrD ATPase family protein [Paludicola sp. MB14-C6]
MKYLIGIDAGGTKTTATAYSMDGEALFETVTGFGNVTVDFEKGMANIQQAVDAIVEKFGDSYEFICLGCSGIETGNKKDQAREYLTSIYGEKIYVTNDALLALYAALEGSDGALVIAGTGSIGYLKQGDEVKRFGGWGHLINDDGSGYSIVIKAIRYIAYSFDTNQSDTELRKQIFEQLNITELRELIDFTYHSTKGEIAALMPAVVKAANKGDFQAQSILCWAGERLAYLAIGLAHQYHVRKLKIAVSGSVIRKIDFVKESFRDTLNSELSGYRIFDQDFNPTKGAFYIYQEK